ncbi:CLC_0170 family protein [Bacillus sp. FJAT-29814]|uniref:CLC_0170 family protein n=1 Tax=Bacillus sp. FJAT-29814 TaxID=1729688 RepID=UPI0008333174|nr:CLC_0170 family protein [Bacillus sp. FJAT-29814]
MNIGYMIYIIILFFLSGLILLLTDVKKYKKAAQDKEQKVSLILAWINISIGMGLSLANWIYQNFVW